MKNLWLTFQLFFSPNSFCESAVAHVRMMNANGRVFGDPDKFRLEARKRIAKKRRGLLVSFVYVAILASGGFAAALTINAYCPLSHLAVKFIRLASVVIVAWAVLARIGYETETMSRETLLEIASANAFKQMYWLGVLLGSFALFVHVSNA